MFAIGVAAHGYRGRAEPAGAGTDPRRTMESRNPVLNREFASPQLAGFHAPPPSAGDLQTMYDGPGGASTDGRVMTLDDVVVKTGMLFVLLVGASVAGWYAVASAPWVVWVCALVAFGLAMAVSFKRDSSPLLIALYALFEGAFLGGISNWYLQYAQARGNESNIVVPGRDRHLHGVRRDAAALHSPAGCGRRRASPRC